jgi:hypothetical protein
MMSSTFPNSCKNSRFLILLLLAYFCSLLRLASVSLFAYASFIPQMSYCP